MSEIINQDIAEQLFNTEHLFLKRSHTTNVFSCLGVGSTESSLLQSASGSPEVPEYGFGDVNINIVSSNKRKIYRYSILRRQKQCNVIYLDVIHASACIKSFKKFKLLEVRFQRAK